MSRTLSIEDYEITKDGNVINKHTGRVLKGQPNGKGYLRVSIGGKLKFIHRMVAEKYIPNPNNYEQVNHINGIKTDNRVENLEWVSNQQNRNHAIENGLHTRGESCSWSKLTWDDVVFIRENYGKYNMRELGEMFGVSRENISSIIRGESWKTKN